MKKFIILIISLFVIFGCSGNTSENKPTYVEIEHKQTGVVEIPKAYIIGVSRGDFIIQRFDYEGNTYLLYKNCIIQVK